MSGSFASISALLDSIIEEEVHEKTKSKFSLYLTTSSKQPIYFYDVSKVRCNFPQDDLEAYLHSNPSISAGSTVHLQNCDVNFDFGKANDIVSCQIESKKVTFEVGTEKERKTKDCKICLQVETEMGQIPLLPSTRRYIRRIKKQGAVRKEKVSKIDILSFLPTKSNSREKLSLDLNDKLISQVGLLDTDSLKILEKLIYFIDKEELFSVLAGKPLKHKASKKAVRLMVIPNDKKAIKNMRMQKKMYRKEQVQQLFNQYKLRQA